MTGGDANAALRERLAYFMTNNSEEISRSGFVEEYGEERAVDRQRSAQQLLNRPGHWDGEGGDHIPRLLAHVMGREVIVINSNTNTLDTDARLSRRFELEKARGVLPDDFPSMERARLMFDLRQGYVFRARAGFERESMVDSIDYRVNMILENQK